jgi:outer membrane protein TolC
MKLTFLVPLLIGTFAAALPATSQTGPVIDLMDQSARSTPSARAAEADIDRARATADRIASGPYEIEVTASGGQRTIDDPLASEDRYTEWSAGISRTIRLPEKARIDRNLARIETELAGSALDQVLYEERQQFAMLWSDWRRAELLTETSSVQADEAWQIAELEQIAVDRGAARQIRADQLEAEASLLQLQAEKDMAAADMARAALIARYPDIRFPERPVPLDFSDDMIASLLEARAETMSAYRRSQLVAEKARLQARRARSESMPDPTLGLDFGNEFGGSETSIMARITIPIGGSARRAYTQEMSASAKVAELNAITMERQFLQALEAARHSLRASIVMRDKVQKASESAARVLDSIRKGYELNEITLTELLNSRRAYISTQRTAAEQRAKLEADLLEMVALTGTSDFPESQAVSG